MSSTKLEIFKIFLQSDRSYPSFQKLVSSTVEDSDSFVFLQLFQKFINNLDIGEYHRDDKKKKAFAGYDIHRTETSNPSINPHSENCIIEGVIEGGKFGKIRGKSEISDKNIKESVAASTVITDKFYFFIHTPLNSDIGIVMFQSYSSDNISDVFTKFLKNIYSDASRGYRKCKIERFYPKSIIEDFERNSIVTKFAFTTKMVVGTMVDDVTTETSTDEFVIKVEAKPKNKINQRDLPNWLNTLRNSNISLGRFTKVLSNFTRGQVYLQNSQTSRESPYELSGAQVKPVIYLEDRITVTDDIPDFAELKQYCFTLLEDIKQEVYPIHQINEF